MDVAGTAAEFYGEGIALPFWRFETPGRWPEGKTWAVIAPDDMLAH